MPVSAPGAMSTRTDRQPVLDFPSEFYGDAKDMREIQQGAPMYAEPAPSPAPAPPTGLFTPSGRPQEPITSGVDFGAGGGSDMLAASAQDYVPASTLASTLGKLSQARPNDERLARLRAIAQKNGW